MDSWPPPYTPNAPDFGGLPRAAAHWTPAPWLFTSEDALELDSLSSVAGLTLTVSGAVLTQDLQLLPFSWTHVPNSNRTVATTRTPTPGGWLQHVRVVVSAGAPTSGQVFVWIRSCRGTTANALVLGTIVSGYVTATTDLYWPGWPSVGPLDGQGTVRSITGTAPGAGNQISEVVPTGARWELISFLATLTTDAVVANRIVDYTLDDGTNIYMRKGVTVAQTASLTNRYGLFAGVSFGGSDSNGNYLVSLPIDNRLLAGHRIRTITTAMDAGDTWAAPQYLVREWLEGN